MARPKTNTQKKEVFLSPDILEKLKQEADQKGMSVSGLIRFIILEYLKEK